jgi:hypothetical protein
MCLGPLRVSLDGVVDEWHPRAGRDYSRNWHELLGWFPDDGACLRFLERLRWREGFVCAQMTDGAASLRCVSIRDAR